MSFRCPGVHLSTMRRTHHAPRTLRTIDLGELSQARGGTGPGLDLGSMQQMMDQQFAQQLSLMTLQQSSGSGTGGIAPAPAPAPAPEDIFPPCG
jgi:hypothetical protein